MSNDKEIINLEIAIQEETESSESSMPYLLGDTLEETQELYQQYEKDLNTLAYSYAKTYGLDKSDLFIEALLGLSKAVDSFDNTRSDDFNTYAITKIKDSLEVFVRRMRSVVSIPAYISKAHSIWKRMTDPTLSEADRNTARKMLENAATRSGMTIENLIKRAETLPTKTDYEIEAEYNLVDGSREVKRIIATTTVDQLFTYLSPSEKRVAEGLMDGWSQSEIAETYGITPSAVSQTVKKMKRKVLKLGIELEDVV